ncbi:hypothetical protein FRC01_006143 [Tulasnella sp. 417]|nr:hypothetical protein FRC01_006143 [Tulasnella sp. 417]
MELAVPYQKFNNLPAEILSAIFLDVLPYYEDLDEDTMGHQLSRKILSLVCKLWRQVVVSTPTLWSLFDIDTNSDPAKIRLQVERAKSAFLNVRLRLDFGGFCGPYSETTFGEAIAAVATKAGQWRSLCIGGRYPGLEELYSWVPKTLPHLRSASVQATFNRDDENWAPVISTPSLQKLMVAGDAPFFFKGCAQLQKLRLVEITEGWGDPELEWQEKFKDFVSRLSQDCPNLRSLSFESAEVLGDDDDLIMDVPNPEVWRALASLNVLEFSDPTFPVVLFFVHHLTIPSPFTLDLIGINPNPQPFDHRLSLPSTCHTIRFNRLSLSTIRRFLMNTDSHPELLLEIIDTKEAFGLSIWQKGRNDVDEEAKEIISKIRKDWDWLHSNAKVRWGFPGLPSKDRVAGLKLREAVGFVRDAILLDRRGANADETTELLNLVDAMLSVLSEESQ